MLLADMLRDSLRESLDRRSFHIGLIISTVFITMIFGIIYFGIILHTNATLQWAVENSVRSAVIAESTASRSVTSRRARPHPDTS